MKTYTIEVTATAKDEIRTIHQGLLLKSEDWADRWMERLLENLHSLTRFPESNGFAPEESWYQGGLRELDFGKRPHVYRILYEVQDRIVFIVRVRYGCRDLMTPESW